MQKYLQVPVLKYTYSFSLICFEVLLDYISGLEKTWISKIHIQILQIYMYVRVLHVWGFVCTCMYVFMCVHVCTWGWCKMFPSIILHITIKAGSQFRAHHFSQSSPPVCCRNAISASRALGLQVGCYAHSKFTWLLGISSGPHACMTAGSETPGVDFLYIA